MYISYSKPIVLSWIIPIIYLVTLEYTIHNNTIGYSTTISDEVRNSSKRAEADGNILITKIYVLRFIKRFELFLRVEKVGF